MFGFSLSLSFAMANLSVENIWVLLLLPLVLLPFLSNVQSELNYSSLALLPTDRLSQAFDFFLKILAAIVIAAIILGISGLHQPAKAVERIGRGAQTVILFDSSTSMDTPYSGNSKGGAASRVAAWGTYESKGQVARKLLGKFVEKRQQDLFAIFVFSRNPVSIMPLSNNQNVIQAAIKAGSYERGLGTTNLGAGLLKALTFFDNKPFKGSRIIMLVSDGAAKLVRPVKEEIRNLLKRHRVTLYWLYLRDKESHGLTAEVDQLLAQEIAPEQAVNQFFSELDTPYRSFSADDPQALEDAIAEVNKLQKLPIRYEETIPKQDLSNYCYGLALALLLLLTIAKLSEIRSWH